jgi:hypothetical protein
MSLLGCQYARDVAIMSAVCGAVKFFLGTRRVTRMRKHSEMIIMLHEDGVPRFHNQHLNLAAGYFQQK